MKPERAQAQSNRQWQLAHNPWDLGVGLAGLGLYTLTLSPGVLPADSGEYQVTGALLGVAHPPGFALYTLLSWLISRTPFAAPATAINWFSAWLAAGALALAALGIVRRRRASAREHREDGGKQEEAW